MSKIVKVVKVITAPAFLNKLEGVVSSAKALNSLKVYKGKDKVDKALSGASRAIDVAIAASVVLKSIGGK